MMIGQLKALVLTVAVALASGAAAASPALAQGFLTSDGPVTLTAEETGEKANAWTMFGAVAECPGFTYTGHKLEQTPHELIPNGATAITVTPHHSEKNCLGVLGLPTAVDMNTCDFVLHLGATTGGVAGTYGVTTDVVCPPGKTITTTLFTNETKHAEQKPFCQFDIQPQFGIKGAHATSTGNGYVDVSGTFGGIDVLRTNLGEDPLLCPNGTTTTSAQFDIDITIRGHNAAGGATAISISD